MKRIPKGEISNKKVSAAVEMKPGRKDVNPGDG